jgi:hypothetical protein
VFLLTVETGCVPTDERTELLSAVYINDSLQKPPISKNLVGFEKKKNSFSYINYKLSTF